MVSTPAQCAASRRHRQRRIDAGRCVVCGLAAVAGQTRCAVCCAQEAAAARVRTARRKRQGICPRCKVAAPAEGRVHCGDCLVYYREASHRRRSTDSYRAYQRGWRAARYRRRLDAGLCPQCGKRPFVAGRTRCQACLDAAAASTRARYVPRRPRPTPDP